MDKVENEYMQRFKTAWDWTNMHQDIKRFNPQFNFGELSLNFSKIHELMVEDFKEFIDSTEVLPGQCFAVARDISWVLMANKIPHAITIGDVILETGKPFVTMTYESLRGELSRGYEYSICPETGAPIGKPANAHCWITLPNGQIIDATIISSQARSKGLSLPSVDDCLYYFGKPDQPEYQYDPYMTGYGYHMHVLMHPQIDSRFPMYAEWLQYYQRVMDYFNNLECA